MKNRAADYSRLADANAMRGGGILSAFSTRFRSDASDLKNRKQFETEEFFISNFSRATINRVFSSNFKGFSLSRRDVCLAVSAVPL
jgi:hypothetical protein